MDVRVAEVDSDFQALSDADDALAAYVVDQFDEALARGWIRVFYQPVVRTVTGKLCGMEALARWDDPERGILPPRAFVGALEDARLIHKLDSYMVRQVCRQIRDNIDSGVPVVPVSFNLSRLDFDLCDIYAVIEGAVHEFEVPRSLVNVEITESVFGSDPAFMAMVIERLHEIGYQVWMDDFGSAYSSLNVLKSFDFDELKIDLEFLNEFGERSRTIIASVVDMAKRLGVQTLAEGVETPEHREFLRHIGCEKQQGYLYGKPQPFSLEYIERLERELGVERQSERQYYRTIGGVNTLSLSERDFIPDNTTKDYVTSMPLAFLEYDGELFRILDCNDPFVEGLRSFGIPDAKAVERLINDKTRLPARTSRRLVGEIESMRFVRQDYVTNGQTCVVRAKFLASQGPRTTVLVTIDSAESTIEYRRRERMTDALEALYSIYEHVDILHLDEGRSEPVYSQSTFKRIYDIPDLHDAVRQFAVNEIYPPDRPRYLDFMNPDTLMQRIHENRQGFIVGFFRTHDRGGDYVWKAYMVIDLPDYPGSSVLVCIRDTNWENDALFQMAYGQEEEGRAHLDAADLTITDGSLWRAFVRGDQFGMFWKNLDRQFIGCNQEFLDYFGFESMDSIIGKTDEEMGWHVNSAPFVKDELRVLEKGESLDNAVGEYIVRGRLRTIVANKRPVYRNGRIVGLVGYFMDSDHLRIEDDFLKMTSYTDTVTGVLNYGGLDRATERFIEAYQKNGTDFSMLTLGVEDFENINDQYGYEYGDEVLRCVAETVRATVGPDSLVGRIYANRFVVLRQRDTAEEMLSLGAEIQSELGLIAQVDGVPCTVYTNLAAVQFSEAKSLEAFKRIAAERIKGNALAKNDGSHEVAR